MLGEIEEVLAAQGRSERLREGLVVAIAGPPNVGKSTLMNALARREVALRETMLRIAGAIMVLEEVLSAAPETGPGPETATPDTAATAVPDTAVRDTAVPDTTVPDTAVPGTSPAAAGRGPHGDGQPAVLTVP